MAAKEKRRTEISEINLYIVEAKSFSVAKGNKISTVEFVYTYES